MTAANEAVDIWSCRSFVVSEERNEDTPKPGGAPPVDGSAMVIPPNVDSPPEPVGGVQSHGGLPAEPVVAENRDPELLRQAAEYGLTTAEIDRFGDNATLQAAMSVLDRRIASLGSRGAPPGTPKTGGAPQGQPKPFPGVPESAPSPPKDTGGIPSGIDLDFDPDIVDPKVAKAIRALHDRIATTENETRISRMENVLSSMIQRTQRSYVQEFDGLIAGLGSEYEDLFGAGSTATLSRQGMQTQVENRMRLDRMMGNISKGIESMGHASPALSQLMKRALAAEFGDRIAAKVRGDIRNSMEERAGQTIARSAGHPSATGDTDDPILFMRRQFEKEGKRVRAKS